MDTSAKIFLAATSSSTVATWGFWQDISWLWKSLSAVSACLAVALPILNWNKKISTIADLHGRWIQIRNEHESLWRNVDSGQISGVRIEEVFQAIRAREADAETSEQELLVRRRPKLVERCYQEVLKSRGIQPR
jgi:hypothetical protein